MEKQEREESGSAARQGGSKHTDSVPKRARERKAKKSLKVEGWDYMVSLPNPKRSARSAHPSASPTLPCPSARASRVGRTAASHPYLRVVTAPVHKRSHSKEQPFPSRQIPKLTVFCTIHSAKFYRSWISLLPFLNYDFAFHLWFLIFYFHRFQSFSIPNNFFSPPPQNITCTRKYLFLAMHSIFTTSLTSHCIVHTKKFTSIQFYHSQEFCLM